MMIRKQIGLFIVSFCVLLIFNSCDSRLLGAFINPEEYDFGYVETSKTMRFTIKNNTSQTIKVNNASFIGTNADKFTITNGSAPFYIYSKSIYYVTVQFAPNGSGQMEATFILSTDFKGSYALRANLKGYGLVTVFDPLSHDFGLVKTSESASKTFTLKNSTQRTMTVNSFDITGVDASHFSISSGTPGSLPINGQIQVTVDFDPYSVGVKKASLNANTSDSVFQTVSASLTGEGDVYLFETFDTTTMCDTQQTFAAWGTGTPGKLTPYASQKVYNPTSDANLNADSGPYSFSSVNIPSGVVITVTGTKALEIYCKGTVVIDGELNLNGKDGTNAPNGLGGAGGPGGYSGGNYDQKGSGPGGGSVGGAGGGGGYAVKGLDSTNSGNAGTTYGNEEISSLEGGSGGGGGANNGAGGGGGGGAVLIVSGDDISIGGLISANGGEGGGHQRPSGALTEGGGGGSGGAVKLVSYSDIKFTGGSISVQGGMGDDGVPNATPSRRRGGYGSPGRIRLEDNDGLVEGIGGSIFPIPSAEIVTTPFTGGTGVDGVFNPTTGITLDTTNGPFNFTSVNIPNGVRVTVIGANPLEIYCTGNITIGGSINLSGGAGANGNNPGIGVAGGGDGGAGGDPGLNGTPGKGQGGGHEGVAGSGNGSSGGGFGTDGQMGSKGSKYPGGHAYGNPTLNPLVGGSGGGGGSGCHINATAKGGGGGAGGGAIRIQSASTIDITGEIISDGGEGGKYGGTFSLPGSGGSGGAILIQGNKVLISGSLSARGNRGRDTTCGGGYSRDYDEAFHWQSAWGGDGRIRLEAVTGNIGGMIYETKGKYACPDKSTANTLLTGTCSVSTISNQYGIIAQSNFFDSTKSNPIWQNAIVNGTDLHLIKVQFQGASDDGNGNPDPTSHTQWYDDLSALPQIQYVRFKVYFTFGTGNPSVDDIELPFN